METPSPNGANGHALLVKHDRQIGGRFAKGNSGGPGNPFAKRVAELRQALFDAVTPDDLTAVVVKLVAQAKSGDVASIRELLQRLLGPPEAVDLMERLDALEQKIDELAENRGHRGAEASAQAA
jgi:hypothetical protein